jgi:hypothetical protein
MNDVRSFVMHCLICNNSVVDGKNLSDGRVLHPECLDSLQKQYTMISDVITTKKREVVNFEQELIRENGIFRKISYVFSGRESRSIELERSIFMAKLVINKNIGEHTRIYLLLTEIYDYYLEYPPDWETRKKEKFAEGRYCERCGIFSKLQVHHDIPIGKGGSNKIENLVILCDSCHKQAHGVDSFRNTLGVVSDAFDDKISLIREAIVQLSDIEFLYKKPTDDSFYNVAIPLTPHR